MSDYLFFAMPVALGGAITAVLMRFNWPWIAMAIAASLAITTAAAIVIAYTNNDDYAGLFALMIGEICGLLALGALFGLVSGHFWQRKRG